MPNKYEKSYGSKDQIVGHGLTAGQLDKVHDAQKRGQAITTMKGNVDPDYEFPVHEKHVVHYLRTIPNFDPMTGEDRSLRSVVKTDVNSYRRDMTRPQGNVKIKVLHDPSKEEKRLMTDEEGKFVPKSKPVDPLND